jgi:hypothetical protein
VPESAKPQFVYAAKYLFEHSVHYIHDEWPCDLDIHYNFPGFFAPDNVVFEALWERHATVEVAHWPVPCADFLGQACIVGLHALRDPAKATSRADLDFLETELTRMQPERVAGLSALAIDTGCSGTLGPLLESLGVRLSPARWKSGQSLRHWGVRTQPLGVRGTVWALELREAPLGRKPATLWRALFVPREALLGANPHECRTRGNLTRLRVQRWTRGLRSLAQAARTSGHTNGDRR